MHREPYPPGRFDRLEFSIPFTASSSLRLLVVQDVQMIRASLAAACCELLLDVDRLILTPLPAVPLFSSPPGTRASDV